MYIGLCALTLVTACKRATNTGEREGRADVQAVPVDMPTETAPLECPEGTSRHDDGKGTFEWCERPDGTMHGPSVQRQRCTGLQIHRTTYRDGVLHGDAIEWSIVLPYDGYLHTMMSVCDFLRRDPALADELLRVHASLKTYRDGKREGLATNWQKTGKKSGEGRYHDGLQDGTWRQWDDGKLVGAYEMDMGTGTEVWWLDDGTPWFEWERRRGKRHGRYVRRDEDGQLVQEGEFADDLPHGTWKQWSPDGALLGTYQMVHGTGTRRNWHDNGTLRLEEPMRAGESVETTRAWMPNGDLMLENTHYDDRWVMRSYENGVLSIATTFVDDEKHGDEIHYDPGGKAIRIDHYERSKLVSSRPAD
jgi:antitoxin component YwqK of YwqJK toxin-antitoxin module